MTDPISRADAIEAVHKYFVRALNNEPHEIDEDGDDVFTDMKSVNALLHHNKYVSKALKELPSAEAVPQSEQYKKGFEDAKRAYEIELVRSADAVQGEWVDMEIPCNPYPPVFCVECSRCGYRVGRETFLENTFNYCPNCGARMKGGDDE